MKLYESETVELKEIYTSDLKKEIVAFANTNGGTIYIGVQDSGHIIGVDNIIFFLFPRQLGSMFISPSDPSYDLFMEFVELMCHSFLLVIALNALEMTGSTAIQSLGHIKKATIMAFLRQIILLIPISLFLCIGLQRGIYGVLYAGAISDVICFVIALFIVASEYKKLGK